MDDMTLRGASPHSPAATLKWKQIQKPRSNKEAATMILIITGAGSFLLIANALLRRLPWEKFRMSQPAPDMRKGKVVQTSQYSQSVGLTSEEATFSLMPPDSTVASYYGNTASTVSSTPRPSSLRLSSEVTSNYLIAVSQEDDAARAQRKSARLLWREYNAGLHEAQPNMASENMRLPMESINSDNRQEVHEKTRLMESTKESCVAGDKLTRPSVTVAPALATSRSPGRRRTSYQHARVQCNPDRIPGDRHQC